MRVLTTFFLALFIVAPVSSLQAEAPPLIDPAFEVPDLSLEAAKLEQRLLLLAEIQEAGRQGGETQELRERLTRLLDASGLRRRGASQAEIQTIRNGARASDWASLAQTYLGGHHFEDAAAAAYLSYEKAETELRRSRALGTLAEVYLRQGEDRVAVNLYNKAVETLPDSHNRQRLNVLVERLKLRVVEVSVESDNAVPRACVVFSQTLRKPLPLKPADYIALEPAEDVDVSASGERLCLRGLRHGQSYRLEVRAGLPSATGMELEQTQQRVFGVADRQARISFAGKRYVLPKSRGKRLPLKSVNVEEAELRLYHIHERNLVGPLLANLMRQELNGYGVDEIENTRGALVWEGRVPIQSQKNVEVTTQVSLKEALETRSEGLYVLVARTPEEEKAGRHWPALAKQWLLVSDLGLMTLQGDDGLNVFARSLETAKPLAGVRLELIARNNAVLATARTDSQGMASFAPGLIRGRGGNRPAYLAARRRGGDFNFLQLSGPAFDLSERGVAGRHLAGAVDAYLYSERGVYRPGETVRLSALLRDAQARAMAGLPLTIVVLRPDGTEIHRDTAQGDPLGGFGFEIPLSPSARPGSWSVTAHLDPEGPSVGEAAFLVEDFVPQRIGLELDSAAGHLDPEGEATADLAATYFYGPAAAGLRGEWRLSLERDPRPYPGYEGYGFGLVQEELPPTTGQSQAFQTDDAGRAALPLHLRDLPESSAPLAARIQVALFDVDGRPVNAALRLPIRGRAVEVGLRPLFQGDRLQRGEAAAFDAVALDREGRPVAGRRLAYEWVRERHEYNWYRQNGTWRSRITIHDEPLASGEVESDARGLARLTQAPGYGRYRLEVFDVEGSAAASHRFHSGWWFAGQSPDTPDALELTLDRKDVRHGERLTAQVKAPFAGLALVQVVNDRIRHSETVALPKAGTEIAVEVDRDWGPGAYLLVTAFRPKAGAPSYLPVRALGLGWFAIDRAQREIEVALELPETVTPRREIEVPIRLDGPAVAGQPLRLTLAAVDEGILSLTGFATPAPQDHFLGQRRLAMDLRDLYGQLIPSAGGPERSGGDDAGMNAAEANAQGITTRTRRTVALFERDIVADARGRAMVRLEIPDFAGRLRLMAVAYGKTAVGAGAAPLVVRDPVVAEVLLPRFLAPGDRAEAKVALQNLSGRAQTLSLALELEGGLDLEGELPAEVTLAEDEHRELPLTLEAGAAGEARIALAVEAEGLDPIRRDWRIAVRPAQPRVTERVTAWLEPGQTARMSIADAESFLPGTRALGLAVSMRPEFDAPTLLSALDRYPYGCTEQTISRALPLLYLAEVAKAWDHEIQETTLRARIEGAIRRTLDRQRSDGSFSVWYASGSAQAWLSAYAFDFLTRAQEQGHHVPEAAYAQARAWLKALVTRGDDSDLVARAYAAYTLARTGALRAGELRYFAERHGRDIPTRLGLGQLAAALHIVGEARPGDELLVLAMARPERRRERWWWDYGSDLRDDAALLAILAETAGGREDLRGLTQALEDRFDGRRHLSTQEQAWLLLATHALVDSDAAEMNLTVDGEALPARRETLYLKGGPEASEVRNDGPEAVRLIRSVSGVPLEALPPETEGLRVSRTYFDLEGRVVEPERVRQNELLVVLLRGESLHSLDHEALVVDLLPAGFEIENAKLGGQAKDRFGFLPELSRARFEAARDDRYVAAIDLGPRQRSFALAYLVRAVTPGRYALPGVFLEDMYKRQYRALGPSARIDVVAAE